MNPVQRTRHPRSGFIVMGDRLAGQGLLDFCRYRSEGIGSTVEDGVESGLGEAGSEEIRCHLACTPGRHHLITGPVEQGRRQTWSILYGILHAFRKGSYRDFPAMRTTFGMSLMLATLQLDRRNIEDLPLLFEQSGHRFEVGSTMTTGGRRVNQSVLGSIAEGETATGMSLLSPGLSAGFGTQGHGLFLEAIAGRWLVAVVRILIEPILQCFDQRCQCDNLFLQSRRMGLHLKKQGKYRIRNRTVGCLELFARLHISAYVHIGRKIP